MDGAARLLGRLAGNGVGGVLALPPGHNRAELLASADAGVAAGTWTVARIAEDQSAGVVAPAAVIPATGGRALLEVAPGALLSAALTAYAGAGDCRILLASWREG